MRTTDPIEKQFAEEQSALNARRASWRKYRNSLAGMVNELDALKPMQLSMSSPDWITLSISGDKHQLAEAVRKLKTRGFKTDEKPPAKGATSWNPLFKRDTDGAYIYLSFTGTSCRRVQTGTKTVEVPVYETVCDEIVVPEMHAAQPEVQREVELECPF